MMLRGTPRLKVHEVATIDGLTMVPRHPKLERARSLLERVTYKPGVEIILVEATPYLQLIFRRQVLDSRGQRPGLNDIQFMQMVPDLIFDWDDREFYFWLAHAFQNMEIHECQEWFKVDGVMFEDPHGEEKWSETQEQR